jgi:hypothetical protein
MTVSSPHLQPTIQLFPMTSDLTTPVFLPYLKLSLSLPESILTTLAGIPQTIPPIFKIFTLAFPFPSNLTHIFS